MCSARRRSAVTPVRVERTPRAPRSHVPAVTRHVVTRAFHPPLERVRLHARATGREAGLFETRHRGDEPALTQDPIARLLFRPGSIRCRTSPDPRRLSWRHPQNVERTRTAAHSRSRGWYRRKPMPQTGHGSPQNRRAARPERQTHRNRCRRFRRGICASPASNEISHLRRASLPPDIRAASSWRARLH